jgi:hypothetical protein
MLGTCGLGTVEREANLNPVGCVLEAAHHPTGSPAKVAAFWATFLGDQQPTLLFLFSASTGLGCDRQPASRSPLLPAARLTRKYWAYRWCASQLPFGEVGVSEAVAPG